MMKELLKNIKKTLNTYIIVSFVIIYMSICVCIGSDIESAILILLLLETGSIISTAGCIISYIKEYIEKIEKDD